MLSTPAVFYTLMALTNIMAVLLYATAVPGWSGSINHRRTDKSFHDWKVIHALLALVAVCGGVIAVCFAVSGASPLHVGMSSWLSMGLLMWTTMSAVMGSRDRSGTTT